MPSVLVENVVAHVPRGHTSPNHTTPNAAHLLHAMDTLRKELEELRRRERDQQKLIDRLNEEILSAAEVQNSLLRARIPTIAGLAIDVLYEPLDRVSGDSYDIIPIDEDRTAFVIADAAGHDFTAALMTTYVHRALRDLGDADTGHFGADPAKVLGRLNRELVEAHLRDCQFVAATYAVFDRRTRSVRWARAGAPYPVLLRGKLKPRPLMSRGTALGCSHDAGLEVIEVRLEPGDTLLFFSDGVESTDCNEETPCVSVSPLYENWYAHLAAKPTGVLWADWCGRFVSRERDRLRHDDVTILALEIPRSAIPSPGTPNSSTHAVSRV